MELNNYIRAFWYMSNNFGDNLNYYIIKKLSKKEPVYTDNRKEKHFIVCGSILSEANEHTTVWGAGLAHRDQNVHNQANIIALRGKLSQSKTEQQAKIFGDPALLMPLFYNPIAEHTHKLGIIPHWKDLEKFLFANIPNVKIINPLQNVEDVINNIVSCEKILSSSLHGLILSDAYGVPNKWLDIGSDIGGDGFKFKDYYSTTDSPSEQSTNRVDFSQFVVHKYSHEINALKLSCPFLHEQK
jgi:pyruvyltransferase